MRSFDGFVPCSFSDFLDQDRTFAKPVANLISDCHEDLRRNATQIPNQIRRKSVLTQPSTE